MISVLSLKFEAFRLSLLVFVSQVSVSIRLFLEIHRWPRSLSSLVRANYFTVLRADCNTAINRALQFSRYLLEKTGIPDRDKNARLNPVKLIKYSRFRAFLAPF